MTKLLLTPVLLMMLCASVALAQNPARGARQGGPGRGPNREQLSAAIDWGKDVMPSLTKLAQAGRPPYRSVLINHYAAMEAARGNSATTERLRRNYADEDKIFQLVWELESAPPPDRPALREKIRVAVEEMIQANLKERADRIDKLKKDLADQEKRLEEDRERMDQIVKQQLTNRYSVDPATAPTTAPATPGGSEPAPAGDPSAPPR
jgi:hypothetical protein